MNVLFSKLEQFCLFHRRDLCMCFSLSSSQKNVMSRKSMCQSGFREGAEAYVSLCNKLFLLI